MGPGHSFLPGNDAADELARRGALLVPSAIPCSLSPLISLIHSRLFLDWRRTVSSKFFDTQVPSISTEKLALPSHARCVLSRLRGNGYSPLLSSYLSRIGRIENSFCSACGHSPQDTTYLILHCPATDSWRRSLFGDSLVHTLGSCPASEVSCLPPCPHPSEGVGQTTTAFQTILEHHVTQKKALLINYVIGNKNKKNLREEPRFTRIFWNFVT